MHAYRNPRILINQIWQSTLKKVVTFFNKAQLAIYFSVIFVDLFQYIYLLFGFKFTYSEPTEEELTLNIIVRISQAMVGIILLFLIYALYHQRKHLA